MRVMFGEVYIILQLFCIPTITRII